MTASDSCLYREEKIVWKFEVHRFIVFQALSETFIEKSAVLKYIACDGVFAKK